MRSLVPALILVVGSSAHAQDFVRTIAQGVGVAETVTCVTWNKREYVYRVDAAGSQQTPGENEFIAIDQAFATWQAVADGCSDFKFVRGPRIDRPRVGAGTSDGNVITFRERSCRQVVPLADPCLANNSCSNEHACWDHSELTIGLTTSTYSTRTGIITDSDIELNAAPASGGGGFFFTTVSEPVCEDGATSALCVANDIQNTVTHEIGHVVGLDHVPDEVSTMAPTAPLGETRKRVIDRGTATGFCLTYPRSRPPVPCDELAAQTTRVKGRVDCSATSAGPVTALALLAQALRRRRRLRTNR